MFHCMHDMKLIQRMFRSIILLLVLLMEGCSQPTHETGDNKDTQLSATDTTAKQSSKEAGDSIVPTDTTYAKTQTDNINQTPMSQLEKNIRNAGLVDVQQHNPNIRVNLRYSGTNNFVGVDIYGALEKAYLQPVVARMLNLAQEKLDSMKSGHHLLVWDAVRPVSAQQKLWDSIDKPDSLKSLYVAPPTRHSMHNYGCAVDVTIVDSTGNLLDMGTDFDHFGYEAYPRKEAYCLRNNLLTPQQIANRQILREAMRKAGFSPINTEWWHFSACTKRYAKAHFRVVK